MPVIIDEVVFRGTVAEAGAGRESSESAGAGSIDLKSLVETCVEETLRALEREKER